MHTSPPCAVLIVLSGQRRGARIPLTDTPFLIGADDACELLVSDHIGVAERGWIVAASGGARLCRVGIDAAPSRPGPAAPWEAMLFDESVELAGVRIGVQSGVPGPGAPPAVASVPGLPADAAPPLAPRCVDRGQRQRRRRRRRHAVAAVSALVLGAAVFAAGARPFSRQRAPVAVMQPHQGADGLISKSARQLADKATPKSATELANELAAARASVTLAGLDGIVSAHQQHGAIRLVGFTDSPDDASRIIDRLTAAGAPVAPELRSSRRHADAVGAFLRTQGYQAAPIALGHGHLRIGGWAQTATAAAQLRTQVNQRFPAAPPVDVAIAGPQDSLYIARQVAARLGIALAPAPANSLAAGAPFVRPAAYTAALAVAGGPDRAAALGVGLADYGARNGVMLVAAVQPALASALHAQRARPKMLIMGPVPYAVLRDGSTVYGGAVPTAVGWSPADRASGPKPPS